MSQTATQIVSRNFSNGFKPDPKLNVSEWADQNVILTTVNASEPGKYRTDRTPYLREVMEMLSVRSGYDTVTFLKGAQIGATQVGLNWIGSIIDHTPGSILFVLPSLDVAKKTSKQKIQPLIDACPALKGKVKDRKARDSGNSMMVKEFAGGILMLAGSNSASGLRSMPIRFLFLDEMSAYDSDIEGEGDPATLAKKRTATFKRNKKIFQVSTPTIKGADRTEQEFLKSDQRYYYVPCPHCNHNAPILFTAGELKGHEIKWDKDADEKHLPETAYLKCASCEARIDERYKTQMLLEGEWVATATDTAEPRHAGFHLSSLYSPLGWYTWEDGVREFLDAKKRAEQGDVALLKTFTNTVLGESWVARGTQVSHHGLWKRREEYPVGIDVPMGGLFLSCGADVQEDRIEASVYAWGEDDECWAVCHRIFWGDPSDRNHKCWKDLDDLIYNTPFKHESGTDLRLSAVGIDTGFLTTQVYDYVKDRQKQGVFALKGDKGSEGTPIVSQSKDKRQGRDKRPVKLFFVGGFEAKRLIYGRLMLEKKDGGGVVHFPIMEDFDEEFFEQLTAERVEETYKKGWLKRTFVKKRARNEALDCFAYALAAIYIIKPNYPALNSRINNSDVEVVDSENQQQVEKVQPQRRPSRTRRPKGNWVTNW